MQSSSLFIDSQNTLSIFAALRRHLGLFSNKSAALSNAVIWWVIFDDCFVPKGWNLLHQNQCPNERSIRHWLHLSSHHQSRGSLWRYCGWIQGTDFREICSLLHRLQQCYSHCKCALYVNSATLQGKEAPARWYVLVAKEHVTLWKSRIFVLNCKRRDIYVFSVGRSARFLELFLAKIPSILRHLKSDWGKRWIAAFPCFPRRSLDRFPHASGQCDVENCWAPGQRTISSFLLVQCEGHMMLQSMPEILQLSPIRFINCLFPSQRTTQTEIWNCGEIKGVQQNRDCELNGTTIIGFIYFMWSKKEIRKSLRLFYFSYCDVGLHQFPVHPPSDH